MRTYLTTKIADARAAGGAGHRVVREAAEPHRPPEKLVEHSGFSGFSFSLA